MELKKMQLEEIANELRRDIYRMVCNAGGGHIGASFSVTEILTALYFEVMRYKPDEPHWCGRDRCILSKGHASAALYAVLAKAGFFESSELDTFCKPGSKLGGHPKIDEVNGVEASTGALGHGFAYGVGIALAGMLNQEDYRVFTVLGDGECQEGSVWEAALFAGHRKLSNLIAIVDYNKLQAMDRLENIINMEPFADKWRAFGWNVVEVDGHNIEELVKAMNFDVVEGKAPQLVLAHTVKGKGVSFMEGDPLWHYRMPNDEEQAICAKELKIISKGND